jgi:hypothetical protein
VSRAGESVADRGLSSGNDAGQGVDGGPVHIPVPQPVGPTSLGASEPPGHRVVVDAVVYRAKYPGTVLRSAEECWYHRTLVDLLDDPDVVLPSVARWSDHRRSTDSEVVVPGVAH